MKMTQIAAALTFAVALAACNPNAAKTDAPADAATSADAAQAPAEGAKPADAAPAAGDAGKPDTPAQAPSGAAPNKPS